MCNSSFCTSSKGLIESNEYIKRWDSVKLTYEDNLKSHMESFVRSFSHHIGDFPFSMQNCVEQFSIFLVQTHNNYEWEKSRLFAQQRSK